MKVIRKHWDAEYDVVIGGYGFAGAMSAITAHDAGARVVVYEKMPHFHGNSILSGGSVAEGARKYLRHMFGKATDQEVVEAFIGRMLELPRLLSQLCREVGFELVFSPGPALSKRLSLRQRAGVAPLDCDSG